MQLRWNASHKRFHNVLRAENERERVGMEIPERTIERMLFSRNIIDCHLVIYILVRWKWTLHPRMLVMRAFLISFFFSVCSIEPERNVQYARLSWNNETMQQITKKSFPFLHIKFHQTWAREFDGKKRNEEREMAALRFGMSFWFGSPCDVVGNRTLITRLWSHVPCTARAMNVRQSWCMSNKFNHLQAFSETHNVLLSPTPCSWPISIHRRKWACISLRGISERRLCTCRNVAKSISKMYLIKVKIVVLQCYRGIGQRASAHE